MAAEDDRLSRGRPSRSAQAKVHCDRHAGRRQVDGRSDAGSATIWALAAGAVTIAVALAIATMGAAIVARHRAQSAADLAALAGALVALDGEDVACGRAAALAASNGAHLTACRLDGLDVVVTVETTAAGPAALAGAAHASARAGPIDTTAVTARAGPVIAAAPRSTPARAWSIRPGCGRSRWPIGRGCG